MEPRATDERLHLSFEHFIFFTLYRQQLQANQRADILTIIVKILLYDFSCSSKFIIYNLISLKSKQKKYLKIAKGLSYTIDTHPANDKIFRNTSELNIQ